MITKCLFPVAGNGTRFLPITKSVAKEMLPIVTKPIMHYAVKEALDANCINMNFVTNKNKTMIEDYFDIDTLLDKKIESTSKESSLYEINDILKKCSFTYTRQKEAKGLGDAILSAKHMMGDEAFLVILPDDLYAKSSLDMLNVSEQMMIAHKQYPEHCIVAVEKIDKKYSSSYGIVQANCISDNLFEVTDMVEKPLPEDAPSDMAIIGRYILTEEIFSILENIKVGKDNELQITDALLVMAKKSKVLALQFDGLRFDCGSIDGYIKATNHFYKMGL
jgi:UTP--glucose-1-phosphate uridylyltransferase